MNPLAGTRGMTGSEWTHGWKDFPKFPVLPASAGRVRYSHNGKVLATAAIDVPPKVSGQEASAEDQAPNPDIPK